MEEKIHCPYCRMVLEYQNNVVLDINYTIWHQACFMGVRFQSKDKGTLINIIEKYNVFHEILPKI